MGGIFIDTILELKRDSVDGMLESWNDENTPSFQNSTSAYHRNQDYFKIFNFPSVIAEYNTGTINIVLTSKTNPIHRAIA